jgi:peptidoglycan/LPS O-acetylase OafA/YrhL
VRRENLPNSGWRLTWRGAPRHGPGSGRVPRDPRDQDVLDLLVRRGGALLVAGVAAYASYIHRREFALRGGADPASATVWPLSVDGLLLLATVGLLRLPQGRRRREGWVVWLAFLLGVAVSLAANIAAAPSLSWQPMLLAGWPPVALLLAVKLLAHRRDSCDSDETEPSTSGDLLLVRAREVDARHRQRPSE